MVNCIENENNEDDFRKIIENIDGLSENKTQIINMNRTNYFKIIETTNSGTIGCVDNSFFQPIHEIKGWELVHNIVPITFMPKANYEEAIFKNNTLANSVKIISDYQIEEKDKTADEKHIDYVIKLDAISLCSDKNLRKKMEIICIKVHGVIWILTENIKKGILSLSEAEKIYKWWQKRGHFLPKKKISDYLDD